MLFLRVLIKDHRRLALLLVLCALFVKALVPPGYMVGPSSKFLTVQICADVLGTKASHIIEIPMEKGSHDPSGDHSKASGNCAFTSLAMGSMAAADVPLLALALAFILLLGFAAVVPAPLERVFHLRPPLRGPPATV